MKSRASGTVCGPVRPPASAPQPASSSAKSSTMRMRAIGDGSLLADPVGCRLGRYVELVISITSKSPYALQALAELGRCGGPGPVPIGELARRREIPVQFLEQLFAVLRRAGILRSQRGVKGGYCFARDPSDVTVLEIVELLDGPLGREAAGVFAEAAEAARNVLASRTIADVVERERRASGSVMYYI